MLNREDVRDRALEAKDRLDLTWPQVGEAIGRGPVYAALLAYGYGQATDAEAEGLVKAPELPAEARAVLMKAPRTRAAVAHELFGDGIMSAIDMAVDIRKVEDPPGVPRMVLTLNGKWLQYKKF